MTQKYNIKDMNDYARAYHQLGIIEGGQAVLLSILEAKVIQKNEDVVAFIKAMNAELGKRLPINANHS